MIWIGCKPCVSVIVILPLMVAGCRTFNPSSARLREAPDLELPVAAEIDEYNLLAAFGVANVRTQPFRRLRIMQARLMEEGCYVIQQDAVAPLIDSKRGLHLTSETEIRHLKSTSDYAFEKDEVNFGPAAYVVASFSPNIFVDDAREILKREVPAHFSSTGQSPPIGTLRVYVEHAFKDADGSLWIIPNMLLFFLPSLFGMPVSSEYVALSVEVEILDAAGEPVTRYRASAEKWSPIGLYFGYYPQSAMRRSAAFATLEALADIREQMRPDLPQIRAALNARAGSRVGS